MFDVGQGCGSTRYCVLGVSLVADVTTVRGSTGDFGDQGRRLPNTVLYVRDLTSKDCGSVDEWEPVVRLGVTWVSCPMTRACQPDFCPWSAAQRASVTGKVH